MLSNCFIFLALSFISPSSETLVGGYTEFHLPNADEIQTFKTLLNLQIPTFLGLTASDVDDAEILGISSQVVSGINYRINVRLHNGQCYLVTVFQSLPSREDGTFTRRVTSVELIKCP
uniref:Cystatin 6 n=1 Tax=Opisthorchis viverrini TaxID=6198 RepID=A0AA96S2Z9_OPIVI|nr:cystatin 6 [Opisthorchis viverrini]